MKNLTCSILILLAFGCSKKSPDSAPIAPSAPTETRETLSKEILKKAENNYLSTLEIFESSSTEKLKDQEQAYLAFEKEATHYLNLLKLANTSVIEIDKVKDVISSKKARYLEISSLLQKLNDSLSTLEDSKLKLKKFKKDTSNFQLTKITELGLRDLILETISIYNNSSTFLKLTFESELEPHQASSMAQAKLENDDVESIFAPYFTYKSLLDESKQKLSTVGFDFSKEDHTKEAITYSVSFYKTLEEYLTSISTFKKDASIFLNTSDLKRLKDSSLKIESTLQNLSELKTMQKDISNDLQKIRLLGYDLPENIGELKEDELKWKSKIIYVAETLPMQGEWQIGYHIAGQRFDATPGDLITLNNHWYKLVDKETYPAFDDAFGTAFTRIILYLSKYEGKFPSEVDSRLVNIGRLLAKTYEVVTDYIEGQ